MDDVPVHVDHTSNRFIDKLRLFIRARTLAYVTEKTYVGWILHFIRYHKKKHPEDMWTPEIEAFLNYLVLERFCSKSTQRTALNALVFLFAKFLGREDLGKFDYVSSKRNRRNLRLLTQCP